MIVDKTKEIQARFDAGLYDLTDFDGCGATETVIKHQIAHFAARKPITIHMLPAFHAPSGMSKATPLICANQKAGSPNKIKEISFSPNITFDGSAVEQTPFVDLTRSKYDSLGLHRNIFDQIVDSVDDLIESFVWHANVQNAASCAVSFSNIVYACVYGTYKNIGNKCIGVSYSAAKNPMEIYFSPQSVDTVASIMDFSSPNELKNFKKENIPVVHVENLQATNVYGQSKCHALWRLEFENVTIEGAEWPSGNQYGGFTVRNDIVKDGSYFRNCKFKNFLRCGIELRNQQGLIELDGVHTENSLYAVLFNGGPKVSYRGVNSAINCRGTHAINTLSSSNTAVDWNFEMQKAKDEAAKWGPEINFPA